MYFQSSPLLSVTVLLNFPPVNTKGLLLIQIHFSYCPSSPHLLSSFTISLLDVQGSPTVGPKLMSHVSGVCYGSIPLPGNKFSSSYLHHRLHHRLLHHKFTINYPVLSGFKQKKCIFFISRDFVGQQKPVWAEMESWKGFLLNKLLLWLAIPACLNNNIQAV